MNILNDEEGLKRDAIFFNSVPGLYIGGKVSNFEKSLSLAENLIDTCKAKEKLEDFINIFNNLENQFKKFLGWIMMILDKIIRFTEEKLKNKKFSLSLDDLKKEIMENYANFNIEDSDIKDANIIDFNTNDSRKYNSFEKALKMKNIFYL